jgi:antagonist of KipI
MSLRVVRPGLLSSFQDLGRWGFQHLGVSVTGAMDTQSHQMANLLAGNTGDCATLEMTLLGPTIVFGQPTCICLTGARFDAKLDGKPVVRYRPIVVRAGETLAMGSASEGARAYLAVHGGFDLPSIMHSQSTYLRAGFGGLHGRALQKGDTVGLRKALRSDNSLLTALTESLWDKVIYLPSVLGQHTGQKSLVRFMRSDMWGEFTPASCTAMASTAWRVGIDSERMGYRLEGPTLSLTTPREMISEPATFGSIQVPRGGQPIVLMADRQSSGGYPKIGTVASVDLPILAQKKPGDTIRFTPVDSAHAQALDHQKTQALQELEVTLASVRQLLGEAVAT